MSSGYRREIDGLRAFAVLPVIAFHAGFEALGGGYVGVDIFFVISGYLITSILIREMEAGTFSVLRFYQRRARRILPALVFVILCCLPFAWAWMFPVQLFDFAQSVMAVGLFSSNILFWRETGYFEAAAELKPLLHTWSLAVEEQYYVIFPILLLVCWRWGRARVFWLVFALAVLSLALSEWGWRNAPSGNFYLAPTRAWELLAGSLCAFVLQGRGRMSNTPLAALGLAGILFSILYYDKSTPFPSVYALLPVGGTVLIILFAGAGTPVTRFLSWRGFVGIGLISYSAYLWHQPLFAFARIRSLLEPAPWLMAALGLASLGLAWVSWRFVEQPFRRPGTIWVSSKVTLWTAGVVSAGMIAVGGMGLFAIQEGGARPSDSDIAGIAFDSRTALCSHFVTPTASLPDWSQENCRFPAQGGSARGRAIIMGDSHAHSIAGPVLDHLVGRGYDVVVATVPGCAPFSHYGLAGLICEDVVQDLLQFVVAQDADLIVTAFRMQPFYAGLVDNGEGGVEHGQTLTARFDLKALGLTEAASTQERTQALVQQGMADLLAIGPPVILIDPVPEAGWHVPDLMRKRDYFMPQSAEPISTSMALFETRSGPILEALDGIDAPNLYRVSPAAVLCGRAEAPERCLNSAQGRALYNDDDHLSFAGAQLLLPQFDVQLRAIEMGQDS